MRSCLPRHYPFGTSLLGALALALAASAVLAQDAPYRSPRPEVCPTPPCPTPGMPTQPRVPSTEQQPAPAAQPAPEPTFPTEQAAATGTGQVALAAPSIIGNVPGYIDNAIPMTQLRLRFDAAYDDNRPDRAEFFYAKCGCFKPSGVRAPGPPLAETSVDYQDISAYVEGALSNRFSAFVEVPVRFLNPELNKDTTGLADMNAGIKWAFVACDERYLTFQMRTYIPTGDAGRGLGTEHVSLEPALLAYQRFTDRLSAFGELRDWIPIGGTNFAGNVVRYGVGLGYEVYHAHNLRLTPIAEFVGWTVLGGKEFSPSIATGMGTKDASGDTIVNAKLGGRIDFGERSSFYVGYGRALTGTVWYKDILRVEYRLAF